MHSNSEENSNENRYRLLINLFDWLCSEQTEQLLKLIVCL